MSPTGGARYLRRLRQITGACPSLFLCCVTLGWDNVIEQVVPNNWSPLATLSVMAPRQFLRNRQGAAHVGVRELHCMQVLLVPLKSARGRGTAAADRELVRPSGQSVLWMQQHVDKTTGHLEHASMTNAHRKGHLHCRMDPSTVPLPYMWRAWYHPHGLG